MLKFKNLMLLFIGLSFFSHVIAADLSVFLEKIHSMQADFSQVIFDNHGKAVQKSSGKMALQRPGKFRWQVLKPMPQLVVANDKKVWIYDPDLEQVTIKALKQNAGETPAVLLSHNNTQLEKQFNIQHKTNHKTDTFILKPVNEESAFAAIEIEFNNNQLSTMKLKDHLGHKTQVTFKNIKLNSTLASSLFNFKPKAGLDVIDETRT